MNRFEFMNKTKLVAGDNALFQLDFECSRYHIKKALILTDNNLVKLKVVNHCLQHLTIPYYIYDNIPVDSSVYTINEIASLYEVNQCDGIIAIGGGSVLDSAKGAYLLLSQETNSLEDIVGFEAVFKGKEIPFFAIPTTSGTGSEATSVAVISHPDKNIKMEIISEYIQSDVTFLEPLMTLSLPLKTTIFTAIDALTHAIEAYSCSGKNPISDIYATSAISLIIENIHQIIEHPNDKNIRLNLAIASYLAGCAFSNSMVGIVHGIGHALGAVCHIPHGEAMAMLLIPCMKFNKDVCIDWYGELLLYIGGSELYATTPIHQRANKTIECLETLLYSLNMKISSNCSLTSIKSLKDNLDDIIEKAMNDGAMIVNKKNVSYDDVYNILGGKYGY